MQKITQFFTCLCLFFLWSCTQEETTILSTTQSSTPNSPYFVSIEKARIIAQQLNLSNPYQSSVTPIVELKNSIKEETVVEGENLPTYYVFNYDNVDGFVFISADLRSEPILAYSPTNAFSAIGSEISAGLAVQMEEYIDHIDEIRASNTALTSDIVKLWQQASSSAIVDFTGLKIVEVNNNIINYKSNTTSATWGPLVQTQWGQGCGYNNAAPHKSCSNCNSRALVGCVATATGQIMRYWQHPSNYNWSNMPTGNQPNNSIANLLRDIGDEVNMDYGCSASGAQTNDARKALENDFDYSTDATYKDYSMSSVKSNIQNNRPVIVRACRTRTKKKFLFVSWYVYSNCHAWVCDGVQTVGSSTLLHMNWGWSGSGDAWFTSWNVNGRNYQYKKKNVNKHSPIDSTINTYINLFSSY